MSVVLEARGLKVHFPVRGGLLRRQRGIVRAVDGVDLSVPAGGTLSLVGESGCGKTTTGRALVRLEDPTGGSVLYTPPGREQPLDLASMTQDQVRTHRRGLQIIFQDPYASLNPRMRVGRAVGERLDVFRVGSREERDQRVADVLERVGLSPDAAMRFPGAFSGGQRQRIAIARAIVLEPSVVVCDEPLSALDVSVQARILGLLADLQVEHGVGYLFISHDLSVVRHLGFDVAVMYLGRIVETGPTEDVFASPAHPYTQALLSAVPRPDPKRRRTRIVLDGEVPSPADPPAGCAFHTRCPVAEARCRTDVPVLEPRSAGHPTACHLA